MLCQFDPAKLRKLRPSFKESGGSVTAGNASSIRFNTSLTFNLLIHLLLIIQLGQIMRSSFMFDSTRGLSVAHRSHLMLSPCFLLLHYEYLQTQYPTDIFLKSYKHCFFLCYISFCFYLTSSMLNLW